jgi:hypothetical protein
MLITREQQEKLVAEYNETNPTTDQLVAFIEGMTAAFKLIDKVLKDKK